MGLLLTAVALVFGGTACTDAQDPVDEAAVLAVTVDAAGDERQRRAMDIAGRYAPQGNFSLEREAQSEASTTGTTSARASTVVVFEVDGDVDAVIERLRDEPHVVDVARR